MIRDLISNRGEDYSFYISCDCSREIIQFYYYRETTICPMIIGVRFYGNILDGAKSCNKKQGCFLRRKANKKSKNSCGDAYNSIFSYEEFCSFVDEMNDTNKVLNCGVCSVGTHATIGVKHEGGSYISISKSMTKEDYSKGYYLWDIIFHKNLLSCVVDRLNEMKEVIGREWKR